MQSNTLLLAICFFLSKFNFLPQALAQKCIGDNDLNIIDPSPDCPDPDSNAEIDETKYQGDIDLGKRAKNAVIAQRRKWKQDSDGFIYVPYTFEANFSSKAEAAVQQAIEAYTNNTCIRFGSRSNQSVTLLWAEQEGNNNFHWGVDVSSREQQFTSSCTRWDFYTSSRDLIGMSLWRFYGTISKEFVKGDADQYTTLGIDYDYSSILHDRATMFSANGEPTIVPKKAGVEIGQRLGLSTLDAEKINALYNCNGISGETTISTVKPTSTNIPTTKGGCFDKLPLDICEQYKERICSSTNVECCRKTCNLCVSITTTETPKPELEC